MAKIKVFNENKHNVGIVLENSTTRNIAPGSFALLSEDDIAFIMSTSTLFRDKHLTLKDDETIESLGVTKEEVSFDTDDEIIAKLKKSNIPVLKKYLSGITQHHLQARVVELAKKADLAASKMKVIEDIFDTEVTFD